MDNENITKRQDKLFGVLKKIDDALLKKGQIQFQKRIHRITKIMLSLISHGECYVSDFCVDGENKVMEIADMLEQKDLLSKEMSNEIDEKEVIIEPENVYDENNKEIDGIISFIEDELKVTDLIEENQVTSGSSDCGDDDFKQERRLSKEIVDDKFLKIEGKLRTFLGKKNIFDGANFDSFLNLSKLKTPLSKVKVDNRLPAIANNFWIEENILQKAKKRLSVRDGPLINHLGSAVETMKYQSNLVKKISPSKVKKPKDTGISSFDTGMSPAENKIEDFNEKEKVQVEEDDSKIVMKRTSIFKDRFFIEGILEENCLDEITSEASKDYISEDEDDQNSN